MTLLGISFSRSMFPHRCLHRLGWSFVSSIYGKIHVGMQQLYSMNFKYWCQNFLYDTGIVNLCVCIYTYLNFNHTSKSEMGELTKNSLNSLLGLMGIFFRADNSFFGMIGIFRIYTYQKYGVFSKVFTLGLAAVSRLSILTTISWSCIGIRCNKPCTTSSSCKKNRMLGIIPRNIKSFRLHMQNHVILKSKIPTELVNFNNLLRNSSWNTSS